MKQFLIFFLLLGILNSCSTNKVTTVKIINKNEYPVSVTVKTINIKQTFKDIKPGEEIKEIYDWTEIKKEDGQWIVIVQNLNNQMVDSFSHGIIRSGELSSFLDIETMGRQLTINVSE